MGKTECRWCDLGEDHNLCGTFMATSALNRRSSRAHCYWCKQTVDQNTECQECLDQRQQLFRLVDESKVAVLEAIRAARLLHADLLLVGALSVAAGVLRLVLEKIARPPRGGPELRDYDGARLESDLAFLLDMERRRAEQRRSWWKTT